MSALRDERLARLRGAMAQAGIDVLALAGNAPAGALVVAGGIGTVAQA